MEAKTINILVVEDNPEDVFLLHAALDRVSGTRFKVEVARNLNDAGKMLENSHADIALLDLTLPDSKGLETFLALKSHAHDVPIIILSGMDDEALAVKAVHAGAEDYLVKGRVDSQLITRAILYAIERTEAKKAVVMAEEKFRGIFENSVSGIFQTSPDGRYISVNPALARIYGYNTQEELMEQVSDIGRLLYVDPKRREEFVGLMQEQGLVKDFESQIFRKDGSVIWIAENARAVRDAQGQDPVLRGNGGRHHRAQGGGGKTALFGDAFSFGLAKFLGRHAPDRRTGHHPGRQSLLLPDRRHGPGGIGGPLLHRHLFRDRGPGGNDAEIPAAFRRTQDRQPARAPSHVSLRAGRSMSSLSNSFIELEEGRCLLLSIFRDVTVRKQAEERERLINAELARSQAELRKKNEILEDDLKMAREIQQAILPQQYPAFPSGDPPGSQPAPLLPSLPSHRPGRRRFFQRPAASRTRRPACLFAT